MLKINNFILLQKKLLAVYLHDDSSVSAHVFCQQVLCDISIVDYLSNNYLVWGWDLTYGTNKTRSVVKKINLQFNLI